MITSIRKYVSSDGIEHATYEDAFSHEKTVSTVLKSIKPDDYIMVLNPDNYAGSISVWKVDFVTDFYIQTKCFEVSGDSKNDMYQSYPSALPLYKLQVLKVGAIEEMAGKK